VKSKHIHLKVFSIDLPLTAIVSIMHRLSGLLLFVCIPLLLYFFKLSSESNSSFLIAEGLISNIYIKLFLRLVSLAFIYHFMAGARHIFMDIGFCESKRSSKNTAIILIFIVLIIFIVSILL